MNKKAFIVLLTLTLMASLVWSVSAAGEPPKVVVDGRQLTMDVAPVIENGRILVPLQAIFGALSASVDWDASTQTVTAAKGGDHLILTIGATSAYKNEQAVTLDTPARIVAGRTLVPLRFVSQALNASVAWDGDTQTATITSPAGSAVSTTDPKFYYENATSYIHSGDYAKAADAFSQAISLASKNSSNTNNVQLADYYFQRGHLYTLLDYDNLAINDYTQAISLDPQTAVYYDYLGAAYLKQDNDQVAMENFQKAASLGYIPRQVDYIRDENIKNAALPGINLYKKSGSSLNDPHMSAELRYLLLPTRGNGGISPLKKVWTCYDQATNTIYVGFFLEGTNFDAYAHEDLKLEEDFNIAVNSLSQYHPGAKVCGWVQLEETIADPNNPPNHGVEATYRQGEGNSWIMEFIINYFGENTDHFLGTYREAVG